MLDLSYYNLIEIIKPHIVEGRTESTAFLYWFLVNIYRLDVMEVEDIVCDGRDDKGIDGIYINHNEECIDVFQSKIVKKDTKTLGDTSPKEFIGTLTQLKTEEGINTLIQCSGNDQLKSLLKNYQKNLVSFDYSLRGIFITNADKDSNADRLLETISSSVDLEIWDKSSISQMYVPSEKAIPATSELSFDVSDVQYSEYKVNDTAKVVIALLSATDLVKMEGLQNQQIFDLNLRKNLRKTKVNKDILKSIKDKSEHINFPLYHNGITIICSRVDTSEEGKIKIKDYSVVNGCQSLSCLYEEQKNVTQNLKILSRIIELEPRSELIPKITYNSNNQNGIKARDFRSNTPVQVRLKTEIDRDYPEQYFYQIKTGEKPKNIEVIDNALAGQILLAFDLKRPWDVQRPSKIFDEWHKDIFARPEVNGDRIVALFKLYKEIEKDVNQIKPELFSKYQITKFLLLYILAEYLLDDEIGKKFCTKPELFYQNEDSENKLLKCIHTIIGDIIIDLNAEFDEKGGEKFDLKTTLKSSNLLKNLKNELINSYRKLVHRRRVESFSQLWKDPI